MVRKKAAKSITAVMILILVLFLSINLAENRTVWNADIEHPMTSEFLSDAYFFELEELFETVKNQHDQWFVFDGSEKAAAQAVISRMMHDLEHHPEALTGHPNFNRYFETFDEHIREMGRITKEMHFFRNKLNAYSGAPEKLDDMITLAARNEWRLFSARYHKYMGEEMNAALNVKFVSANGRFEAVYNTESGQMVVDAYNMGTYNYAPGSINPIEYYKHHIYDKVPWKKWGNTEEVSYRDIVRLESGHGTNESKKNAEEIEKWIRQRRDDLKP